MKYLLLIVLSFALTLSANAQEIGFSIAPSYSFFNKAIDGQPGVDVMFLANHTGKTNYQLEAGYSLTRGEIESIDVKYEYIKVALLPKFLLKDNLRLIIGPQFGYLINGKFENVDISNTRNSAHLSLIGGIAYRINQYEISTRYNHGFTDLGNDLYDRQVQISFAIFF